MSFHKSLLYTDGHIAHAFEYANAAARTGASVVSADVGKIARQTDTGAFYILTDDSPVTWAALGGGGGGGGVVLEGGTSYPVPVQTNEYDSEVFKFTAGGTESLYWRFKVPNSYSAGAQLFLYLGYYSPDTSNTLLISATSYLIRPGTDAANSVANSYNSTNSAVTLSGAANLLRTVTLDLSSSSGQINSIALAAGHEVLVRIYRGSDTSTSDARIVARSGDPKFSA